MKSETAKWRVQLRRVGWKLIRLSERKWQKATARFRPGMFEVPHPRGVTEFLVSEYGAQVVYFVSQDKRGVLWRVEQVASKPGARNAKGQFVKQIVQVRDPQDRRFCYLEVPLVSEYDKGADIDTPQKAVAWTYQCKPGEYNPNPAYES